MKRMLNRLPRGMTSTNEKQIETVVSMTEIVKTHFTFASSYSYESVKKYTNYDDLRGQVAYEFIYQVGANLPNGKLKKVLSNRHFEMFYTGTNEKGNLAPIGNDDFDFVNILGSEREMGPRWTAYCAKVSSSSSFKILILEINLNFNC